MGVGAGNPAVLATKHPIPVLNASAVIGASSTLTITTTTPGCLIVVGASDWLGTATVTGTLDGVTMSHVAAYTADPGYDYIRTAVLTAVAPNAGTHTISVAGLSNAETDGVPYKFVQAVALSGGARSAATSAAATLDYQGSSDQTAASIRVARPSYVVGFAVYNTGDTTAATFAWTALTQLGTETHEGNGIDVSLAGGQVAAGVTDVTVTATFPGVGGPYTSSLLTLVAV